jgi:hypothetical protein
VAASSEDNKMMKFFMNGEFSSLIENNEVVKAQKIKQKNYTEVETLTLNTILKETKKYQLLSIDVEKHEIEVLMGYDISQHDPFFAIIETHEKDYRYEKKISKYCDYYFYNKKYIKYFSDRVNTIYIHKKIGQLL